MNKDSDDIMLLSLIAERKERETVTKKGNKVQKLKFIKRKRSAVHGSNSDDSDDDGSNATIDLLYKELSFENRDNPNRSVKKVIKLDPDLFKLKNYLIILGRSCDIPQRITDQIQKHGTSKF